MTRSALLPALLALALVPGAGCRRTPRASPSASPSPSPAPSPSAPPLAAEVSRFEAVLPDGHGGRRALLRGTSAAIDGGGAEASKGVVRGTSAILYRDGKPALELVAPVVEGDAARGTVVARGGVAVRTIGGLQTTRLRSDTMTWHADSDLLEGRGDVLMTHGDAARVPGDTFRADTRLRRVLLTFGDAPATGRL